MLTLEPTARHRRESSIHPSHIQPLKNRQTNRPKKTDLTASKQNLVLKPVANAIGSIVPSPSSSSSPSASPSASASPASSPV